MLNSLNPHEVVVDIKKVEDPEAELDEMWSYVQSKEHQRWLWHAIDHNTGKILAYTLGDHKDEVFLKLKELLEPFGVTIPRQSRGLSFMSRSKRLIGVANAAPPSGTT